MGINETAPRTKLEIKVDTSSRTTVTRALTLNANGVGISPYEFFGTGIIFEGYDYGNITRDYAYIDSVMTSSGLGSNDFKSALDFYTNSGGSSSTLPTKKLTISSAGEVQTPSNPAFRANAQSGWAANSGWQKVIYNANVTTRGTGYSSANSRFTAPVDGWYQFNAQWTANDNADADGTFSLWINGSSTDLVGSVSIPNTGGAYSGHVVSGCCYLATGAYVEAYRYSTVGTTTRSSAPYGGWFSGFLIG